jgi:hypothetical protein
MARQFEFIRMKRFMAYALVLAFVSYALIYAWGPPQWARQELLQIVPLGSSPARLEKTAAWLRWTIDYRNIRSWPAGSPTYMDRRGQRCRSRGGLVVPVIVAHYSNTYVESLWLFDGQRRLSDVCVRKDIDAL